MGTNWRLVAYDPADAQRWDEFVATCPMGNMLHTRRYMDYHGELFRDASLVAIDDAHRWLACIPAAADPHDAALVVSHPGITYGGWLHSGQLAGTACIAAFTAAVEHWRQRGFSFLRYKAVPWIYHRQPTQDDLYALHRLGAQRDRCDLSCAIALGQPHRRHENRKRSLRKALRSGISVRHAPERLEDYWRLLTRVLASRHATPPTHTYPEIRELQRRHPEGLHLIVAENGAKLLAGTLLYLFPTAVHTQYIASGEEGNALGALDAVFDHCIAWATERGFAWFDFGNSNEEQGKILNDGLYRFKCGFGGAGVLHEFYRLPF